MDVYQGQIEKRSETGTFCGSVDVKSLKVVWFERVITTRANLGPRPEFAKQFNYETDERIWSG